MTLKERHLKKLCKIRDEWNSKYPIGTIVEYHPVIGEKYYRLDKTVSEAKILEDNTVVVWLEIQSGCVDINTCIPEYIVHILY